MGYQEIQFGEVIGHGSYGTVHKGAWKGQTVALKRIKIPPGMDKTQMLANNREIAALRYASSSLVECKRDCNVVFESRLLKHPNIVSLLGHAASVEEIVLIMNFVTGSNLDVLIFGRKKVMSEVCVQLCGTRMANYTSSPVVLL